MVIADRAIYIVLCLFFVVGLNIYTSSAGGQGFEQSINSMSVVMLTAVLTFISLIYLIKSKPLYSTNQIKYLFALVLAIAISSLFHENRDWDVLLSIACVVLVGIGIFISLNQSPDSIIGLLWIVVIAAVAQCIVGGIQLTFPEFANHYLKYNAAYMRPYGIFGQVNVYASFITTGFAACLYLLLRHCNSKFQKCFLALSIVLLASSIAVSNSRTANLSFYLIFILACIDIYRLKLINIRKLSFTYCIILLTPLVFLFMQTWQNNQNKVPVANQEEIHEESHTRELGRLAHDNDKLELLGKSVDARLFIYSSTLNMILDKPIIGYGYGKFESAHIKYMAGEHARDKSVRGGWAGLKHPHNIILYLWVEGGILPVIVLLVLVVHFFWAVIRSNLDYLLKISLIVPIGLHSLTELPLTASIPHIFLLGLLCGFCLYSERCKILISNRVRQISLVVFFLFSALFLMPYAFLYSKTYINVLNYEKRLPDDVKVNAEFLLYINEVEGPISNKIKLLQMERVFNRAMETKKAKYFAEFLAWAEPYLVEYPSVDVYRAVVMSNLILQQNDRAKEFYRSFMYYYPDAKEWEMFRKYFRNIKPAPLSLDI